MNEEFRATSDAIRERRVPERDAGQLPIESSDLFGGARTVAIRHGDDVYTLRITRSDKLILTK